MLAGLSAFLPLMSGRPAAVRLIPPPPDPLLDEAATG